MSVFNVVKFITNHPLNQDKKLQSMLRFAKWQIGSRLVPGEVLVDWINGSKFLVRPGETGLTGNIYTGLHEFSDMGFLLHVLKDEDLFVDAGANVGSYTILASAAIGARAYTFEPVPGTYKRLVENIRLNHLEDKVKCLNVGLGKEQDSIAFTSNMNCTNHALAAGEHSDSSISVDVSTLDHVLAGEWPAVMKIDVEGFETPVLEGAQETLKKQTLHSLIIELNESGSRYGYKDSQVLEILSDHGFKTYSYNPLERVLTTLSGKNPASPNTLFIRDYEYVSDRLRSAPRVIVNGKQF